MSSTSESGHAKNVANFETLINFCISYNASYNPSGMSIKLNALNTLLADSKTAMAGVNTAKASYDHVTNVREVLFKALPKLCTRVINALEASGTTKEKLQDARSIINKINGRRVGKIEEAPLADPNGPNPELPKNISVSHKSYDSLLANFSTLIQLLLTEPNYLPNETELSIGNLSSLKTSLDLANQQVSQAAIALSNARIIRDNALYLSDNSLCETALDVKKYIKSVFSASSAQYKQVGKISFANRPTAV